MATVEENTDLSIPKDWIPAVTWHKFFYKQQRQFVLSDTWQRWFISANGCFGKGTEVLMFDGSIKRVEDIMVGDVLMGDDSTPRNVLRLARGREQLYEFEINQRHREGMKYVFNENHILYLESVDYESPVEVTVKEYLKWGDRKKRGYHFAKRGVEYSTEFTLKIPPYILGCWLGDGDSNGRRFSNIDEIIIQEFQNYIEKLGCRFRKSDKWHYQICGKQNNGSIKNDFCKLLEGYNLKNNKHIPDEYLFASYHDRLELLAGLIDTDGSYNQGNHFFWQTDDLLTNQVCFLARSLGINANIYKRGVNKSQNCVSLCRKVEQIPCRLKRKQANKSSKRVLSNFGIRKVTPLGEGDYYGFTLDGNHRFLGADFTVLRNTGKSLLLYWQIVAYSLGVHPRQFAELPLRTRVLVPSFDLVEEVALVKLLESQQVVQKGKVIAELGPLIPHSLIKKGYSKDHPGIDLKNGSSITWVTEQQGWKLMRGPEQDILAVDEESDERVFDENKRGLRNAKNGGKILGCLTPPYEEGKGPTWTKEKIVDAAVEDPDIEVFTACMADNPAITELFIKRFSKGKTTEQIDVQVFGRYPSWGKTIHPFQDRLWDEKKCDGHLLPIDMRMPENREAEWLMAFDWHASKPCAALWGYIDRDGNVVIFDELDKQLAEDKDIRELSDMFKQIEGRPFDRRKWRRRQDPSAKHRYKAIDKKFNAWDEFRKHGIITGEGKNREPEVGISIVNDYLKGNTKDHPRLFVRENCRYTRQYMSNHYWKRSEGNPMGKPDAKWSDYPICIRYLLQDLGKGDSEKKKWPLASYKDVESGKKTMNLGRLF